MAWSRKPVDIEFEGKLVRHALRDAFRQEPVAELRRSAASTSRPLLIVYEGAERERIFDAARGAPKVGPDVPLRDPKAAPVKPISAPAKSIRGRSSGRTLPEALDSALRPHGVAVQGFESRNVILAQDVDLQTSSIWPLNRPLGDDAKRILTCREAEELLREEYGWYTGWTPGSTQPRNSFCKCGNDVIWDGSYPDAHVRDLVFALVQYGVHSCLEDPMARRVHYQIIPRSQDRSGNWVWDILRF